MSTVTIGFVPRERFSLAPESLRTILECTTPPFNLIVVDCNTPTVYWQEMEQQLRGRDNVKVIRHDQYLLPNQCKNLVMHEAQDEFLCLIENDNLVEPGWLSRFLESMESHQADVVIPLIMEGRPGEAIVHFDEGLGRLQPVHTPEGPKWQVLPRPGRKERDVGAASRTEQFMETHCLFFRRSVFDRIGPFDEEINTSEEVDLSLALINAKASTVFDPACTVHYIQPPQPVCSDDRAYFLTKWDVPRARRTHERIVKKWNLVRMPQLLGFVEERNLRGSGMLHRWREELASLVPPGASLILVDSDLWSGTPIVEQLRTIPFLERDGQYWGAPAESQTAIREFERLRQTGAAAIAFAWYSFWWFQHYSEFYDYLRSRFPRVVDNDHLVAFDLRA